MVLTAHPLACWSYEAKGLLLCPSSCKVFLTELIHFRMWWNASLSTTSFSNSSCGLRGFSSHLTWDLAFSYSQILGWSPLKALQGWVCERPAVWCLACQWGCLTLMYFGAWYLPRGEYLMWLSPAQHQTSSWGSVSEDPRGGGKTAHDLILDIMWQYFHYVLFAVKPRDCRLNHSFLEASSHGLSAMMHG